MRGAAGHTEQDAAEAEAGHEPDYRFTLANERTFLAWIRTSLGLLAAGVAVHQLIPPLSLPGLRTVLGLACVGLGAIVAATSYPRWRRVQRAMRANAPLPRPGLGPALATGVLAIAVICGMLVILGPGGR